MSSLFLELPDERQKGKRSITVHDTMMSGFACMFFQDPSILQFQKQMEDASRRSNMQTLFGVERIPGDTQMREIIDKIRGERMAPVFKEFLTRLQRSPYLKAFQFYGGSYLCPIDGTQYFSSETIHCSRCLTKNHRDGIVGYSHQVLQAAIVHPAMRQAIPLMPEEIRNTDGKDKQDCEINAGKRLIPKIRSEHPGLKLTIAGDALYAVQPFITLLGKKHMHYILGVKPDKHKVMMGWIDAFGSIVEKRFTDEKGKVHLYEWVNGVPLNGTSYDLKVNFFRYSIIETKRGKEQVNYRNSWITDFEVTEENVGTLVEGGRARWKIENECFNTLKNQGYYIEHNYGHGSGNLCFNFYLFTLIAFYFHQIFELTDTLYQDAREKFGSKRNLWEKIRSYINIILFESWNGLLGFLMDSRKAIGEIRVP